MFVENGHRKLETFRKIMKTRYYCKYIGSINSPLDLPCSLIFLKKLIHIYVFIFILQAEEQERINRFKYKLDAKASLGTIHILRNHF